MVPDRRKVSPRVHHRRLYRDRSGVHRGVGPEEHPGFHAVTFQIATVSGICIAYFVGLALSGTESWRLILSLAAIPALIVLFLVLRLPDTARGLMMVGRRAEAVEVLRRVDPDVDPEEEADIIERDLSYEAGQLLRALPRAL